MSKQVTASEARASLQRLIHEAAESHQPIMIRGKRANAVLISEDDWHAIQETLFLLSIPGMRQSVENGKAEPLSRNVERLDW